MIEHIPNNCSWYARGSQIILLHNDGKCAHYIINKLAENMFSEQIIFHGYHVRVKICLLIGIPHAYFT